MTSPLAVQLRQELGCRYDSGGASNGYSDSVAWSRSTSGDLQHAKFPGMGRVAPVLRRRVVGESGVDGEKQQITKSAGGSSPNGGNGAHRPPPAFRSRAKPELFSHKDAVLACKGSNSFFSNLGQQGKFGSQSRGTVTQVCTFEGTLEDYFQLRSTDGSSGGEGSSCSASERGSSDDKASTPGNSLDGATPDRRISAASRQPSLPASKDGAHLSGALAADGNVETDDERQPSGKSTGSGVLSAGRDRSDASRGSLCEATGGLEETVAGIDERSAGERDQSAAQEQTAANQMGEKRGRLIELEMKDGCVVWPTDRPVIPLPHWQLTSFSQEPLNAQQWAQLPTVGGLSPYAELLEQPAASTVAAVDIRRAQASSNASRQRGASTPPAAQPVQTTLPRIKLPVGCEAPPLTVQIGTLPYFTAASEQAPSSPTGQVSRQNSGNAGRALRCNSFSAGPRFPSLGAHRRDGLPGAMYTDFSNKHFIQHKTTGAEGEVLRSEDNGASLVVRLKNGRIKKFDRTQCRVIKAVCTPSKTPSDRQLTAAAHHHALAMMMNRSAHAAAGTPGLAHPLQFGSAQSNTNARLPAGLNSTGEQSNAPADKANLRKLSMETLPFLGSASKSLLGFLSLGRTEAPNAPAAHSHAALPDKDQRLSINPALRGADQVPRVEDLVKFAQQQASSTTANTLVVGGPTSHPSIRAVGSHVSVEAVRTKKYVLDDGEEGNMVPVFSRGYESLQAQEAEEAQWLQEAGPQDPAEILRERHRALEELRQRQMEAQEEEIIYAQDAPEATLAPGIVAPTIIKESLVMVPKEQDDTRQLVRAPGIVHPLVMDVPDLEIIRPATNAHQPMVPQILGSSYAPENGMGVEWYASLQQQVKNQLLQHYARTGNLQAATAAVTGSGFPAPQGYVSEMSPYFGHNMGAPAVQRRQAKVLREEADQIEFVPMA
uniref:Uncharacterized protein n=1 Tax=Neospora caninum (strain Liverpool) TaxID=572307 RepID=F0JB47_NEOCL|nr:hypothetical protein, conserved [Neospora caninum Liverpool]CEL71314.1 TPA: hypothetical protein, conserved [Neospora caninum Liverpool]